MMLIRHGECIYRTFEQQHSFNFPFQLGTGSKDSPMDALFEDLSVQEGDIVILGTDGIWDNVFVRLLMKLMSRMKRLLKSRDRLPIELVLKKKRRPRATLSGLQTHS